MKHTIKLLTLAFTLAAILTLTGCPGPVNTVVPCTHENKKTVIETAATCTETGLEKIICADCGEVLEKQKLPIDPENHDWVLESDTATCTENGEKTYKCSRCDETKTENIPAHHTFIAGGCDECGEFKYSGTQVKVYVYTFNEEKELNDLGILYYSFEETDKTMNLNDLLHLKPEYKDYTVAYGSFYFSPNDTLKEDLKTQDPYSSYEHELESSNQIGIIIEPQTN